MLKYFFVSGLVLFFGASSAFAISGGTKVFSPEGMLALAGVAGFFIFFRFIFLPFFFGLKNLGQKCPKCRSGKKKFLRHYDIPTTVFKRQRGERVADVETGVRNYIFRCRDCGHEFETKGRYEYERRAV
jgi:rubredoxin